MSESWSWSDSDSQYIPSFTLFIFSLSLFYCLINSNRRRWTLPSSSSSSSSSGRGGGGGRTLHLKVDKVSPSNFLEIQIEKNVSIIFFFFLCFFIFNCVCFPTTYKFFICYYFSSVLAKCFVSKSNPKNKITFYLLLFFFQFTWLFLKIF